MKKKLICRGLLGFPLGIALEFVITLVISGIIRDGNFYPAAPELIQTMGNELNAVLLQTVLSGVLGAGFAMASVIWEIDRWSLARQSGIYFGVVCLIMLPVAYLANWMQHTLIGVACYVGCFVLIYLLVWVIQYFAWKRKIRRMNERVEKRAQ